LNHADTENTEKSKPLLYWRGGYFSVLSVSSW